MNLTHDPADIIRHLIIALGSGTLPSENGSWPVFSINEPDTPDNCITVYNTQGSNEGRIMFDGQFVDNPGIQVRVRGVSHAVSYAKAKTIEFKLDTEVYNDTIIIDSSTYLIQSIGRTGMLLPLGKDSPSSKRYVFTLNSIAQIRQIS
jgi:hypothetical protein